MEVWRCQSILFNSHSQLGSQSVSGKTTTIIQDSDPKYKAISTVPHYSCFLYFQCSIIKSNEIRK